MNAQHPRSTATTPLSPRQQVAQAAQRRFMQHANACPRCALRQRCLICEDLDAKAEGAWVRAAVAEQRKAVSV